jgi:hypothetical protein
MTYIPLNGRFAGENLSNFDSNILNERSNQTIVQSKRSDHLVLPMKNTRKTSMKGKMLFPNSVGKILSLLV